jgi:DNA mismatch repair ATPase MutL
MFVLLTGQRQAQLALFEKKISEIIMQQQQNNQSQGEGSAESAKSAGESAQNTDAQQNEAPEVNKDNNNPYTTDESSEKKPFVIELELPEMSKVDPFGYEDDENGNNDSEDVDKYKEPYAVTHHTLEELDLTNMIEIPDFTDEQKSQINETISGKFTQLMFGEFPLASDIVKHKVVLMFDKLPIREIGLISDKLLRLFHF